MRYNIDFNLKLYDSRRKDFVISLLITDSREKSPKKSRL